MSFQEPFRATRSTEKRRPRDPRTTRPHDAVAQARSRALAAAFSLARPLSRNVPSALAPRGDALSGSVGVRFFFLVRGFVGVAKALATGPRGITAARNRERGANTPDSRCNGNRGGGINAGMSAPNSLLDMEAVRALLGMDQAATGRTIRRRLRSVAESRGATDFWLGKLAGKWHTTEADMRALVPELYAHEARALDSMHDVFADVVAELGSLKKRLAATEAAMVALRSQPTLTPRPAQPQRTNPAQLDFTTPR